MGNEQTVKELIKCVRLNCTVINDKKAPTRIRKNAVDYAIAYLKIIKGALPTAKRKGNGTFV